MTDRRQPRDPHGGETKQAYCVPAEPRGGAARSSSSPPVDALQVQDIRYNGEFVSIPGGASYLGTDQPVIPDDGEGPRKRVQIKPFRMAKTAVTNSQFAAFVAATGYVTEAERFGWSLVFWQFADPAIQYQRVAATPWWCKVGGASWACPFGPKSDVTGIEDHPVTHVSWHDAQAFAAWMGGRLPTEAEWEYAAHGGNDAPYPWGKDEPNDTDSQPCNIWQGSFPEQNTCADGFAGDRARDQLQTQWLRSLQYVRQYLGMEQRCLSHQVVEAPGETEKCSGDRTKGKGPQRRLVPLSQKLLLPLPHRRAHGSDPGKLDRPYGVPSGAAGNIDEQLPLHLTDSDCVPVSDPAIETAHPGRRP